MTEAERKPPAFWCPLCGQKHRADLGPLAKRPGASVTIVCRRCEKPLSIHLEDGKPVCEAVPDTEPPKKPPKKPPKRPPKKPPKKPPKPKPRETAKAAPQPAARPKRERTSRSRGRKQAPEPAEPEMKGAPDPLPAGPAHRPYDAALSDKALEPGEQVGRYTIKSVVRKGLTSIVYRAHDPTTKRSVGLKLLGAKAPADVRERFLRQVDVQARIRHPNILPVYDRGELDDGRPFMAMELLHHPVTLSDLLEKRADGTLDEQRKLAAFTELDKLIDDVLVPVADGIYVANIENGVVHGDLRPENVLIDGHTLRPYVVDFGRASTLGGEEEGEVVAMPSTHYLSPEQARGQVHARTDVWGLGALLHALVTGKPPLEGSSDALRRAAADGVYATLPPDTHPALTAIVRKAMAPAPSDRYVNARQLTADLKAWRHGGRVRAVDEFGGPGASDEERKQALRVRLRTVGWLAAGLLVGLLVGSRIRLGGEGAHEARIRGIEAAVERYEADVSELGEQLRAAPAELGYTPFVAALTPEAAHRVWRTFETRAESLLDRLAATESSAQRTALEARVGYQRGRLRPAPIVLDAPAGVPVAAENAATGDRIELASDRAALPPGRWTVSLGEADRARVPVCVPLSVRPQGVAPDDVEPRATWSIPVAPSTLPAARVLIVGDAVHTRRLPRAPAGEAVEVPTFAVDRDLVTNAQYARFLGALPEAERQGRAPSRGLERSRARVWRPAAGQGRLPVVGLRPDDARAYCAWASEEEGAEVRLPTEAEWLLAQGAVCSQWARGDLAVDVAPPYGVKPAPEGLREMVASSDVVAKTPGRWYASEPLATDARAEDVGFRCVQVLPRAE